MNSAKVKRVFSWCMASCAVLWLLSAFEIWNGLDQLHFARELAEGNSGVVDRDGNVVATPSDVKQRVVELERMVVISRTLTYYVLPSLFTLFAIVSMIVNKRQKQLGIDRSAI